MKEPNVITRFAPSPTGRLHIGGARTALFNYLFAKKNDGLFYLRVEDTDPKRSKKEFETDILEALTWLSLIPDAPPKRQSERVELYADYINDLIKRQYAYVSKEPGGEHKEVIRFKNPGHDITFNDLIRGQITFNTKELGDFIIAKSITEPLYHLAVVVDDHDMGVTHVIRGEDGISNTPRQILLQKALGFKTPTYAHLPLILTTDRKKLSKRTGGAHINELKSQGYLPSAIINYLALLGWTPPGGNEILSIEELIKSFDITKIHKSGAIFDPVKLLWVNKEHVKKLAKDNFTSYLTMFKAHLPNELNNKIKSDKKKEDLLEKIASIVIDRINVFSDIKELYANSDLLYFFEKPSLDPQKIIDPKKTASKQRTQELLCKIKDFINEIDDDFWNDSHLSPEKIKGAILTFADTVPEGRGAILWPLRYALSGKERSPDPFSLMWVLGKAESIERISYAAKLL